MDPKHQVIRYFRRRSRMTLGIRRTRWVLSALSLNVSLADKREDPRLSFIMKVLHAIVKRNIEKHGYEQ